MSLLGKKLGRYTVVSELGRGQHSSVYKAWQPSLERYVALKVLRSDDLQTLLKFQAEARLTASLIDKGVANIRQVYEVGRAEDGCIFVALEYVEDSLQNILRRAGGYKTRLSARMNPVAAAKLLLPIAQALDVIHALGWVHLDIKPQNILISKDGRAMLADFGIAQRRGVRTHACTPTYASPEQAAGDRPVGPWSDIYSLGAVLYEMVAGQPPVRGDHDIVLLNQHLEVDPPPPSRANAQLSAGQERAILRALAKSPRARYATASDLIEAVLEPDTFLSSVIQTPGTLVGGTLNRLRRVPPVALVGGLLVLCLIMVVLLAWLLWPGSPGSPLPGTETWMATPSAPAATATPSATRPWITVTRPLQVTERPTVTLMPLATGTSEPPAP